MQILLGFAPFILFAVATHFLPMEICLPLAAALALLLMLRDLRRGGGVKLLDAGGAMLFGGLAVAMWIWHPGWSLLAVRAMGSAGLLAIVLASLAMSRPFTLAYAREQVAPQLWDDPRFLAANTTISAVWAAAFAVGLAIELVGLWVPDAPARLCLTASILAQLAAIRFTLWYPEHLRRRKTQAA